jgi:hypothetical protein
MQGFGHPMDIEWLYCVSNGALYINISFKIGPSKSMGVLATTDGKLSVKKLII